MKALEWAKVKLGCSFEEGILYKGAKPFVKGLDCTCCAFWRGFITGTIIFAMATFIIRSVA